MDHLVETVFPALELYETEGQPMRVSGIAAVANTINGNNRVYPRSILQREVEKMKTKLEQSDTAGLVDHPAWSASISDIGLKFTNVWMEEDNVHFNAEIVDTQRGRDLAAVVKAGIRVGISSRGMGTFRTGMWEGQSTKIVNEDFSLESYDAVVNPSAYNARILQFENQQHITEALERILNEKRDNVENLYNKDVEPTLEQIMEQSTEETIQRVKAYLESKGLKPEQEKVEDIISESEEEIIIEDVEGEIILDTTVIEEDEEVIETEESLRDTEDTSVIVEQTAGIVAAIAALGTSISDALNAKDWNTVCSLASVNSMLDMYNQSDSADPMMNSMEAKTAAMPMLEAIAKLATRVDRDNTIELLTENEKFGRTLRKRLRDTCTTAEEVQGAITALKNQVQQEAGLKQVVTKGTPIVEQKYTDEQLRLRQLSGIK